MKIRIILEPSYGPRDIRFEERAEPALSAGEGTQMVSSDTPASPPIRRRHRDGSWRAGHVVLNNATQVVAHSDGADNRHTFAEILHICELVKHKVRNVGAAGAMLVWYPNSLPSRRSLPDIPVPIVGFLSLSKDVKAFAIASQILILLILHQG